MSDPVTNFEIEDVLSSIRRLVAEGGRPAPKVTPDEKPEPEASEPQPDKFVLTPALRVAEDPGEPEAEAPAAPADPLPLGEPVTVPAVDRTAKPASNRVSLEETIAELEAAVTKQNGDWEPDGSEATARPAFSLTSFPPLHEVEDAEAEEVEEAEDAQAEFVEAAETDEVEHLETESDAGDRTDAGATRLTAAALAVTSADRVPNDDTDEHADYDEPTMFRHAEAEDAPAAAFQRHADADDEAMLDDDMAAYMEDDAILDEAALREIVVKVLREELQGPLGERITRNVRKLVRREIRRALSTQDVS